jgi:hypothetical protein
MADFRKSLLLAATTLALSVGVASAQQPTCSVSTGAPPTLRSEGQTELVGAIVLNCQNLVASNVNFDVSLGTTVQSAGSIPLTSRTSEAQVTVNGGTPIAGTLVKATPASPFTNIARFAGIDIPAGNPTIIISGIRANVNPAFVPITTSFGQVLSVISVSNGVLPVSQGAGTLVGLVLPAGSASIPATTLNTCSGTGGTVTGSFNIDITENFPTAFKQQNPKSPSDPDSETGPAAGAQPAQSGTQFAITFNTVPSGVSFAIPLSVSSTAGGSAVLVVAEGSTVPMTTAPIVVAGGTYFYNVVSAVSTATETYGIPVTVGGLTNTGVTADVTVSLAPRATVLTTAVPRFTGPLPLTNNAVGVAPCQTSQLFPFLTNQAGFDTGFSIAATSVDPFGTLHQGGTCTLYFFGANAPTTPPTLTVPAGTEGHNLVSVLAPNFQGYGIAVCNFAYAHGFSFITDGFNGPGKGLAEGYLATVIGNTRPNTPSTSVGNSVGSISGTTVSTPVFGESLDH